MKDRQSNGRSLRRWVPVLAVTAFATALVTACGGGGDGTQPGSLLSLEQGGRGKPLPDAGQNYFVTYASRSASGKLVPVVGQIAIPNTPPPPGGYPVLSWAPGTTGMGPQCAPSNFAGHAASLNEWVKRGYAVLRTDYEGWGDAGPRPLLNQRSNAEAVVDLVKAAHAVTDKLSKDWVVAGHSEGGGAALWTAALGEGAAGPYRLRAAIALAPVGPGVLDMVNTLQQGVPISQNFPLLADGLAASLTASTVLGARVADPAIRFDELVAPSFQPWVDAAAKACVSDPINLPVPQPGQYLKSGPSFDRVVAFLRNQDASSQTMRVPVWIAQAQDDNLTPTPPTTARMVKDLCAHGGYIGLQAYAGQNHGQVVAASLGDALAFANAVLTGKPLPASACTPG